jgi:hypothetical protein
MPGFLGRPLCPSIAFVKLVGEGDGSKKERGKVRSCDAAREEAAMLGAQTCARWTRQRVKQKGHAS